MANSISFLVKSSNVEEGQPKKAVCNPSVSTLKNVLIDLVDESNVFPAVGIPLTLTPPASYYPGPVNIL